MALTVTWEFYCQRMWSENLVSSFNLFPRSHPGSHHKHLFQHTSDIIFSPLQILDKQAKQRQRVPPRVQDHPVRPREPPGVQDGAQEPQRDDHRRGSRVHVFRIRCRELSSFQKLQNDFFWREGRGEACQADEGCEQWFNKTWVSFWSEYGGVILPVKKLKSVLVVS